MEKTLGAVREEFGAGTEYGALLIEAEQLYRKETHQSDFWTGFQIDTFDAMGSAIGMYKPSLDKKFLRPDALNDATTLAKTAIHETRHQIGFVGIGGVVETVEGSLGGCNGNCPCDGLIEYQIHESMGAGFEPVDAYSDLARAAGRVVGKIGTQAYTLASQGAKSEQLLTQAVFEHDLSQSGAANSDVDENAVNRVWDSAHAQVQAMMAA